MKRTILASLLTITLAAAGCTGTADPATATNSSGQGTTPQVNLNPGTVVGQPGTNPASGIDLQNVGPEVVVDQFLRALQQGNRDLVASLLTTAARTETAKFGLEVQPESVPNSAFRIVQAAYLPEEDPNAPPQMAHVASLWAEDGGEEAYEIIWVLRHEQAGWRISAMGLTIDFNQDPLLLDFEHPEEMMKVREQAMQDLANQATEGTQTNPGQTPGTTPVSGQPAFPTQQGVATSPNFPPATNSQFPINNPSYNPNNGNEGSSLRQPGVEQAAQPEQFENPIRR